MTAAQRVDASERTFLAVCSCGWRGRTALIRSRAWAEAAQHAESAHDDVDGRARASAQRAQQRERHAR